MKTFLKTGLGLLAASTLLSACQPAEKIDDVPATPKTAHQINKETPMEYKTPGQTDADHEWLVEVEGEKALAQVTQWNEASAPKMQDGIYKAMKAELLEVYNSPEKIAYVSYRAGKAHNFWQDDKNVRGIWRSTTLESYSSGAPEWETILDFDALAKAEDKNWVYKGNDCFAPEYTKCMVYLSDGGKDATETREFDLTTKAFVNGGFATDESKGGSSWLNDDTLLIGVDFGSGTMTDSGYPMTTRLWKRGTALADAEEIMRGVPENVGVWPGTFENADGENEIIIQTSQTFYERQYTWLKTLDDGTLEKVKLPVPTKVQLADQFKGQQLVTLQEDWRGFKSGSLLSYSIADFMADGKIETLHEVITPGPRQSIENFGVTKSALLLSLYENVSGAAYAFDFDGDKWSKTKLEFPQNGNVSIGNTNSKEDIAFVSTESFLTPDTLWTVDTSTMNVEKSNALPDWFDSESMTAVQHEAVSSDGTKIPYFIVHNKSMKLDGKNPTLLYGYGGFRISLNPKYSATIGRAWLERGGVYVSANTRGGEEFGPDWHQAGLKTKRQLIFDDFIAVAEDLIDREITSPRRLGIHGRSNGGLLMGVMMTQRPDLFNAIAVGVPLIDMMQYHTMLAGASWMGEYGDPDDGGAEAAFLRSISPYHNLRPDAEYPEAYIYTSTKDDRVHPGHARKLAKRMEDQGHSFLYYENIDGGHAGAANLEETAHSQALIYSYFADKLMK